METFTTERKLVDNPKFSEQRQICLNELDLKTIDPPIIDIIRLFTECPYCFPLQSCYGHFVHRLQLDPYNLDPLPINADITRVEYRIAYLALCIDKSIQGELILKSISQIPTIDPNNIQFGCADWFWERQINSYILQVEPHRYQYQDTCVLDYHEAILIEESRGWFFEKIRELLQEKLK